MTYLDPLLQYLKDFGYNVVRLPRTENAALQLFNKRKPRWNLWRFNWPSLFKSIINMPIMTSFLVCYGRPFNTLLPIFTLDNVLIN